MPALNRVQLIGYLGKDPESKFTPTGKRVAQFSVAISNRWKGKDGDAKEYTEWVNIEAWGRLGEICQEYLKKGSLIFVEGRLKTDRYEDEDGAHYFTKVVARTVQFLSVNREDDGLFEQPSLLENDEAPEDETEQAEPSEA